MPRQNAAARLVGERACAGVAVERHDVHEFRRAARRLRQGNSLRSQHGRSARAYAEENFDLDAIATRFEEVLRAASRERAVT